MKNYKKAILILLGTLICTILLSRMMFPCAPYLPEVVFVPKTHPELPPIAFIKGDIGVIQPTYNFMYLVIAYMHIKGPGLSNKQINSIIQALKDEEIYYKKLEQWSQANEESVEKGKGSIEDPPFEFDEYEWRWFPAERWQKERAKVKKVPILDKAYRNAAKIIYSYNDSEPYCYVEFFGRGCSSDAWRTAADTLKKRINQFGIDSTEVIEWLKAQDIVLSNCDSDPVIPPEPHANIHPLIKADRMYQIAASYLYTNKLDEAEQRFRQIMADNSSPWKTISGYLVGRTMIYKAYSKSQCHPDNQILRQASDYFEQLMSNHEFDAVHQYAWELLRFVKIQIDPEAAFADLAGSIEHKNTKHDFYDDLYEYDFLLRNRTELIKNSKSIDTMTDWLFTVKKGNFAHAIQKWKKTSSREWLLASLMKGQSSDTEVSSLCKAAQNIPENSPAFVLAQFHCLRLKIESGENQQARIKLDEIIEKYGKRMPAASLNQFLSIRMKASDGLEEFLNYAQRIPILLYDSYTDSEDHKEDIKIMINAKRDVYWDISFSTLEPFAYGRKLLDKDSVLIINELMPLDILRKATQNTALPDHIRKELVSVVWTRAVTLNRHDISALQIMSSATAKCGSVEKIKATKLLAIQKKLSKSSIKSILKIYGQKKTPFWFQD